MTFSFLDFIFPKRCVSCGKFGSYLCSVCLAKVEFIEHPVCPICQRQAVGGKTHPGCYSRYSLDGLVVVARYRGAIRSAIRKIKYRWVTDIESTLGDLMVDNLWKFDFPADSVLVPIPLHPKRKRWRGFNQAELLTDYLSKKFGSKTSDLLIRTVDTKPQVGLKKDKRRENIRGAFALRFAPFDTQGKQGKPSEGSSIRGKNLILVDDVFTSGATMMEAAKVLKRAGAKSVWAMAVALG